MSTLHTTNALFTKGMGEGSVGSTQPVDGHASIVRLDPPFSAGMEYHGIIGLGEHADAPQHRFGPGFIGHVGFHELGLNAPGGIRYDAAYLRGLTGATFRVRLELEFLL